jgi:RNA polymerase sigma factor (sigma-70 family)
MPRAGGRDGAKFETWLYRVTLNQCYDRLRRKPTLEFDRGPPMSPIRRAGLRRSLRARIWRAEVEAALAELPARQRAAILLCHTQERGNVEAAEILGRQR